jgi:hypothetical protein
METQAFLGHTLFIVENRGYLVPDSQVTYFEELIKQSDIHGMQYRAAVIFDNPLRDLVKNRFGPLG